MYRVIFIFDIGDFYPLLKEAVKRLHQRNPEALAVKVNEFSKDAAREWFTYDAVVVAWLRYQLTQRLDLLLSGSLLDAIPRKFDQDFQVETEHWADRLYRQLAPAILNHKHPCVESWCAVTLKNSSLYLTFDVGPIDYGARHTEEFSPCI